MKTLRRQALWSEVHTVPSVEALFTSVCCQLARTAIFLGAFTSNKYRPGFKGLHR